MKGKHQRSRKCSIWQEDTGHKKKIRKVLGLTFSICVSRVCLLSRRKEEWRKRGGDIGREKDACVFG